MIKNTEKKVKVLRFIGLLLIMSIILTTPVFASINVGENGATWVLDQLFWGALVVVAVVVIGMFLARNFKGMIITIIVAALVLYIVKNPQILSSLGEKLFKDALKL